MSLDEVSGGYQNTEEEEIVPVGCRVENSEAMKDLPKRLKHRTPEQATEVLTLINQNKSVVSDVLGKTSIIKHEVTVVVDKPIRSCLYRINPNMFQVIITEVIIEPSMSNWSSPVILVPKPDGLNAMTVANSFPIPRKETCIYNIGHSQFVTKVDVSKGFWQVPILRLEYLICLHL